MQLLVHRGGKAKISTGAVQRMALASIKKNKSHSHTLISQFLEKAVEWHWLKVCDLLLHVLLLE